MTDKIRTEMEQTKEIDMEQSRKRAPPDELSSEEKNSANFVV